MKKEEILELLPLLDDAETFRPLIEKAFKLLKSYGPEISDFIDGIMDYAVTRRIKSVKMLEDAGFSREDAINLVMDEWYAIARNSRSQRQNRT